MDHISPLQFMFFWDNGRIQRIIIAKLSPIRTIFLGVTWYNYGNFAPMFVGIWETHILVVSTHLPNILLTFLGSF